MIQLKNYSDDVSTIAQICDIHIHNSDRHEEYLKIFDKLYESLKKEKPDLIYIAGDLIHSKTHLSPEVIYIAHQFLYNLNKISPVIVILGNHDVNLTNINRMNIYIPILNYSTDLSRVYLLDKSDIYRYANVDFYNFSIIDSNDEKIKDIINSSQISIALYHGQLNNALNMHNFKFNSSVKSDTFMKYDFALLGDIHRRQSIDKDTIYYGGSLIQQNFGESFEKGYTIWNIKNKTHKFISIHNDNAFYTIYTENGKLPNLNITAKNPRIRLFLDIESYGEKNNILHKIKKLNPAVLIERQKDSIESNHLSKSVVDNTIDKYYDTNVQNKLIRNFLSSKYKLSEEDYDKIFEINKHMEDLLLESGWYIIPQYNTTWNIDRLLFSNIFKYGEDNEININKLTGITGIFGNNDCGKSSILETIMFALFGQTGKNLTLDNIVNDKKSWGKTEIYITVNGSKYYIERKIKIVKSKIGGKRKALSSELKLFKISSNNKKIKLNDDDKNKTEKKIRQLIGFPDDFISTSMVVQAQGTPFIHSGQTKRKTILSKFLGLDPIEEKYKKAKDISKDIEILLKDLINKDYKSQLSILNINIERQEEKKKIYENEIKHNKLKIQEYESYMELLNDKIIGNITNENIDIDKVTKEKENAINKHTKYNENLIQYKSEIKKINLFKEKIDVELLKYNETELLNNKEKYDSINKELINIDIILNKLQFKVEQKLNQLQIIKKEPWHMTEKLCKSCSLLNEAFKSKDELYNYLPETEKMVNRKKELQKKLNDLSNAVAQLTNFNILKNKLKDITESLNKLNNDIFQIEKEIEMHEMIIVRLTKEIESYNTNEINIKNNIEIKIELEKNKQLKNLLSEKLNTKQNELIDVLSELKSNTVQKEIVINEIKRIRKLEDDFMYYKYYIEAMHRDNIPYQIIEQILPKLNHAMTHILEGTVPFSVNLIAEGDKIHIMINYDNGEEKIIEATGGMVKIISGIAIRAGLLNISSLPKSTWFGIDEGFSACDSTVLSSINNLMQILSNMFKNIFIITHIDDLKDIVDNNLDIDIIEGNFSKVKQ